MISEEAYRLGVSEKAVGVSLAQKLRCIDRNL